MKLSELKEKVKAKLTEAGILFNEDESIFSKRKLIVARGIGVGMRDFETDGLEYVFINSSESEIDSVIEKHINHLRDYMKSAERITINMGISVTDYMNSFAKFMGTSAPTEKLESTPLSDLVNQIRNVK